MGIALIDFVIAVILFFVIWNGIIRNFAVSVTNLYGLLIVLLPIGIVAIYFGIKGASYFVPCYPF